MMQHPSSPPPPSPPHHPHQPHHPHHQHDASSASGAGMVSRTGGTMAATGGGGGGGGGVVLPPVGTMYRPMLSREALFTGTARDERRRAREAREKRRQSTWQSQHVTDSIAAFEETLGARRAAWTPPSVLVAKQEVSEVMGAEKSFGNQSSTSMMMTTRGR